MIYIHRALPESEGTQALDPNYMGMHNSTLQHNSTPPISRNSIFMDVEAGSELVEHRRWQAFCEQISKLGARGDVKDPEITEGDAITNKMKVYLDVFGPLMLNRIAGKV